MVNIKLKQAATLGAIASMCLSSASVVELKSFANMGSLFSRHLVPSLCKSPTSQSHTNWSRGVLLVPEPGSEEYNKFIEGETKLPGVKVPRVPPKPRRSFIEPPIMGTREDEPELLFLPAAKQTWTTNQYMDRAKYKTTSAWVNWKRGVLDYTNCAYKLGKVATTETWNAAQNCVNNQKQEKQQEQMVELTTMSPTVRSKEDQEKRDRELYYLEMRAKYPQPSEAEQRERDALIDKTFSRPFDFSWKGVFGCRNYICGTGTEETKAAVEETKAPVQTSVNDQKQERQQPEKVSIAELAQLYYLTYLGSRGNI